MSEINVGLHQVRPTLFQVSGPATVLTQHILVTVCQW